MRQICHYSVRAYFDKIFHIVHVVYSPVMYRNVMFVRAFDKPFFIEMNVDSLYLLTHRYLQYRDRLIKEHVQPQSSGDKQRRNAGVLRRKQQFVMVFFVYAQKFVVNFFMERSENDFIESVFIFYDFYNGSKRFKPRFSALLDFYVYRVVPETLRVRLSDA